MSSRPNLAFGPFVVEPGGRRLFRGGQAIEIQDKPFELLLALLERPGELVPREELYARLWPQADHLDFEAGLNAVVRKLRVALRDEAQEPRWLETVPRHGYRLLASPREVAVDVVAGPPGPPSRSDGRWLALAFGVVVLMVVCSLVLVAWRGSRATQVLARSGIEGGPLRVGVMPLARGLEGPEAGPWERFGEELLVALSEAGYDALGPRWTARYPGLPFPDLARIREELELDLLLNGRPLASEEGFVLELIRLSDGSHPWVRLLDAPPDEAVAISLLSALEAEARGPVG